MTDFSAGSPHGIPQFQLKEIRKLADQYVSKSIGELIADIDGHVTSAAAAKLEYPMVNVPLATLIGERLKAALAQWDSLNDPQQFWLLGAIGYFVASDDEEDDFRSPIGFEDDAEVFNACIRFADHEQLVVTKEEF